MAQGKLYQNTPDGIRFTPGSMNTVKALDALKPGEYAYLQNVRAYLQERIVSRATQDNPEIAGLAGDVYSIRRLNDTTPDGPPSGFEIISGAGGRMYAGNVPAAQGLTGNPVSMLPFRPDESVQPWMYVADTSQNVTLSNGFQCFGMIKIRSDGQAQKWGIAEPQTAPQVSTAASTITGTGTMAVTAYPWTNVGGQNASYNFGQTNPADGSAPLLITGLRGGSVLEITAVLGSATVNGVTVGPGSTQTNTSSFPGYYVYPGATGVTPIVIGAFTDSSGNVVTGSSTAPNPVAVGPSLATIVPQGATQFQMGVDSAANTFGSNSGTFSVAWTIKTSDIATVVSTIGEVTGYYWGDSPHTGPVAAYIWKNPNDGGSGRPRTIGTAAGSTTNNSWQLNSTPQDGTVAMLWDTLAEDGTVSGSLPLFSPALESQGFQDFNACFVGNIFIPAAGTYEFEFTNKDQIMVGMGAGLSVASPPTGSFGQTISVVNSLPLVYVSTPDGEGGPVSGSITVTAAASGIYAIEIDYDYWEHTGREMVMTCNGVVIPPVASAVRTNVVYWYTYRASETGAVSNPSPVSTVQNTPVLGNTLTPAFSPDPQVDKVDFYRQDSGLANPTYVATGPNTNPPTAITDNLTDIAVANNPVLQFDNFEPFPSIDLPKSGVINVVGDTIQWVSGDQFNTRWLPGTEIQIGLPTGAAQPLPPQITYTLTSRPTSATTIVLADVESGNGLVYNIAQPLLAAQPLPSIWGPTDNSAYMFGCGDPLRPGTLYFTKANNPDSAPDTNTIEVTSPSEPLMNGALVGGIGMVFSPERAWLIYPTYTQALATTEGITGQQFSLVESVTNRGLYIRTCICTEGGHTVFFRGKDGIYASPGGAGSISITDDQIYNLFPHEGDVPQPVRIGPFTVWPPDDSRPNAQQLAYANGYLYYDYQDTSGVPRTLVYDVVAKGWSVDTYQFPVIVHALEEGPNVNGVLTGCTDNSIRALTNTGVEMGIASIVATGAMNNGQARAFKTVGDIFTRALVNASTPITCALYADQYQVTLGGFLPTSITGTGTLKSQIIDFSPPPNLIDISAAFLWNIGSSNYLDLWQPSFIPLPASVNDRPTDWDDLGTPGNKFIQGGLIEADTFNNPKSWQAQRSDDLMTFNLNEGPMIFNGQSIQPFTFNPPFLAHSVRRVATDSVPWRAGPEDGWRMEWIWKPYPESTVYWQTEGITHDLKGFQHVYQVNLAYVSTQPVTLTITADNGSGTPVVVQSVFPASGFGLNPVKVLQKLPPIKGKVFSYNLQSGAPFYLFEEMTEVWVHQWGEQIEFHIMTPFGGRNANTGGAEV